MVETCCKAWRNTGGLVGESSYDFLDVYIQYAFLSSLGNIYYIFLLVFDNTHFLRCTILIKSIKLVSRSPNIISRKSVYYKMNNRNQLCGKCRN